MKFPILILLLVVSGLLKHSSTDRVIDDSITLKLSDNQQYDVGTYIIVHPKLQKSPDEITIQDTRGTNGLHFNRIIITYHYENKDVILDLILNINLIPEGHFIRYQTSDGETIINKLTTTDINFCHYHGTIRGNNRSRAVISTCDGVNGVIFDGNETFHIKSGQNHKIDSEHFLYRSTDLATNAMNTSAISSINAVYGPYSSNENSSYIELVIVVDNAFYRSNQNNLTEVHSYTIELVNILNSLYTPLNIFIALKGIVVWTTKNEIEISSNSSITLKNFLEYRKNKLIQYHPNDNAQLLTNEKFDENVVGRAHKQQICTTERSGGITSKHSEYVSRIAKTIAHELGHNLGMKHDTKDCKCPEKKCIMDPKLSKLSSNYFSDCSVKYLSLSFKQGMNHCLKNKPTNLFPTQSCGKGFVEFGEECDCGLPEICSSTCCNPQTCMLYKNASCATGKCCDLTTCQIKKLGFTCRKAIGECDIPEHCTGTSEYCPNDVFKYDTKPCRNETAFCYKGLCQSHTKQCQLLWGSSGKSLQQYYFRNRKGSSVGNCGYNKITLKYTACTEDDIHCGSLQCESEEKYLKYGNEKAAIIKKNKFTVNGTIIKWRTANIDLGLDSRDPGLTPDGAKCGNNKICLNQKCLSIEQLRIERFGVCRDESNGICHCAGHCFHEFLPDNSRDVSTVFYIVSLFTIFLVILFLCIRYKLFFCKFNS